MPSEYWEINWILESHLLIILFISTNTFALLTAQILVNFWICFHYLTNPL